LALPGRHRLSGHQVAAAGCLASKDALARRMAGGEVLSSRHMLAARPMLGRQAMPPGSRTVSHPHGTGPEHTPQLTAAGQVSTVTGTQREVLSLAGQMTAVAVAESRPRPGHRVRRRAGEPVIRVRPVLSLLRVGSGGIHPVRQLRELVTAALTDSGKRHRIPGQVQRDLIRLPGSVMAADRRDGQHGAIDAT
jgi:hypothetical protein